MDFHWKGYIDNDRTDEAVNVAVPAGKVIYIDFDADPASDTTYFHVLFTYLIPTA